MGRFKAQRERVGPIQAYVTAHVQDGRPEHVAVLIYLLAVEPDGDKGVQPIKNKLQPLIIPGLQALPGEFPPVPPLSLLNPGTVQLIPVVKWILDTAGVQQRQVDVTGHGDIDPML